MEHPQEDISTIVKLMAVAEIPEVQRATIEKYFAPDAGLNHPLCQVKRGPNSRNKILGLYQWYRNLASHPEMEVEDVGRDGVECLKHGIDSVPVFNESSQKLCLNLSEKFHLFASPFPTAPAKLLVQLTLSKDDSTGLYLIVQQDDYYQFEDLANLVLPPAAGLIVRAKQLGAFFSNLNTFIFQLFGFWTPVQTAGMEKSKTT